MKLTIEQSSEYKEPEIKIFCNYIDTRLSRLIEHINLLSFSIKVQNDDSLLYIPLMEVYYFDTVDNKVFLYLENKVYECSKKLYEIENEYENTEFVRVSKNCIVNILCVNSVKTKLNGRLEASLVNGEKIIVSRHYIKAFRDKFMQEDKI